MRAWEMLAGVMDPEIPALSVVDLGMIREVYLAGDILVVELMPTFAGCPAVGMMQVDIAERLAALAPLHVVIVRYEPWTSARITAAGREKLRAAGFAPPPRGDLLQLTVISAAACPYCGSTETRLESPFGPTACRAIHYCRACRQPFEQFKAV